MTVGSATQPASCPIDTIVFDLGKVLLDWNPAYYFERHFDGDAAGLQRFLSEVIRPEWIVEMDAGKSTAEAIAELSRRHPREAHLIARWQEGWPQMLRGEIAGTVEILADLRARNVPLYALTNFSTETWPIARARFPFLGWFADVVVSGEVGLVKPDPRIYQLAIARCRLDPPRTLFIDDMPANVQAAQAAGMHAIRFTGPERLRAEMIELGLL